MCGLMLGGSYGVPFRIAALTQDLAGLQGTLRGSSTLDVTADKFVRVEVGA